MYANNFMKETYLRIANYTIKVCFFKTGPPFLYKIRGDILRFYRNFILPKKPKKIDYEIDFVDRQEFFILKKGPIYLTNLYEDCGNNRIITFYQISLIHFSVILRKIMSLLLKKDGFILHAASSFIKNRAILFVGEAGSGKSTAMQLFKKKYRPLADDHVILKKEGGSFHFYQTPFFETNQSLIKKSNRRFVLGKVFFVKKSKTFYLKKIISKSLALRLVMEQLWIDVEYSKEQTKAVFYFVSHFSDFYYLYFAKKSNKLIDLIAKLH